MSLLQGPSWWCQNVIVTLWSLQSKTCVGCCLAIKAQVLGPRCVYMMENERSRRKARYWNAIFGQFNCDNNHIYLWVHMQNKHKRQVLVEPMVASHVSRPVSFKSTWPRKLYWKPLYASQKRYHTLLSRNEKQNPSGGGGEWLLFCRTFWSIIIA